MARRRMLSSRISLSRKINAVSDRAALLYTWIIPHLDELGLMEADPEIVRAQVVPLRKSFTPKVVSECLDELEGAGAIVRYETNGSIYLNYPDFFNHQSLKKDRIPKSEYPLPPWIRVGVDDAGKPNIILDSTGFQRKAKEKRREEKGREGKGKRNPADSAAPSTYLNYKPSEKSEQEAGELLQDISLFFRKHPFSRKQEESGEAERIIFELACILRILSREQVFEIIRRKHDMHGNETRGKDRPTNLKWYMADIREAAIKRDREVEAEEKAREREKRTRARASPSEPVSIAGVVEEVAEEIDLTDEQRERIKQRIREVRERIAAGGAGGP